VAETVAAEPEPEPEPDTDSVTVSDTDTDTDTDVVSVTDPSSPAFWSAFGDPVSPEQRGQSRWPEGA